MTVLTTVVLPSPLWKTKLLQASFICVIKGQLKKHFILGYLHYKKSQVVSRQKNFDALIFPHCKKIPI